MHVSWVSFWEEGWRLFDLDTKEFFVSRDVKFFEDVFSFASSEHVNIIPDTLVPPNPHPIHPDFAEDIFLSSEPSTPQNPPCPFPSISQQLPLSPPSSLSQTAQPSSLSQPAQPASLSQTAPHSQTVQPHSPSNTVPSSLPLGQPANLSYSPTHTPPSISSIDNLGSSSQPTTNPSPLVSEAQSSSLSPSKSPDELGRGKRD